jgi:hypothetical protein
MTDVRRVPQPDPAHRLGAANVSTVVGEEEIQ